MELKPAHETILDSIKHHCQELETVERIMEEGAPTHTGTGTVIPPGSFAMSRVSHIGGLCGSLDILRKTIVPADKLDGLIAGLTKITYRHAAIFMTIEKLRARKT